MIGGEPRNSTGSRVWPVYATTIGQPLINIWSPTWMGASDWSAAVFVGRPIVSVSWERETAWESCHWGRAQSWTADRVTAAGSCCRYQNRENISSFLGGANLFWTLICVHGHLGKVNISVFVLRSTASLRPRRRVPRQVRTPQLTCVDLSLMLRPTARLFCPPRACWLQFVPVLFVRLLSSHSEYIGLHSKQTAEYFTGEAPAFLRFSPDSRPPLLLLLLLSSPSELSPANEPFPVFFRLIYGRATGGAKERKWSKVSERRRTGRGGGRYSNKTLGETRRGAGLFETNHSWSQ